MKEKRNTITRQTNCLGDGDTTPLKISLSNGIFSKHPLEANIAEVKRLGFENMEFNVKSVEKENDIAVYEVKRLVEASGLKCLTLHAASLHVTDEVEVHRAVYYGKISLVCAQMLNAPVMVVHSNIARKLPQQQRRSVLEAIFGELKAYAKELNIKLALENLSYSSTGYGKNVAELEEILGIIDVEGEMGFALDFCHGEATGQTFPLLEKYHSRLCNIHMSNRAHKPFEEPTPHLLALMEKLHEYRYDGPVTLELSKKCTMEEILKTKQVIEKVIQ